MQRILGNELHSGPELFSRDAAIPVVHVWVCVADWVAGPEFGRLLRLRRLCWKAAVTTHLRARRQLDRQDIRIEPRTERKAATFGSLKCQVPNAPPRWCRG